MNSENCIQLNRPTQNTQSVHANTHPSQHLQLQLLLGATPIPTCCSPLIAGQAPAPLPVTDKLQLRHTHFHGPTSGFSKENDMGITVFMYFLTT